MKVIRKALLIVVGIGLMVSIVCGFSACKSKGKSSKETTIECTEHTYGEWTTVTVATCATTGKKERACTVCGIKQEESVAALGHDIVHHVGQEATCTEIGWEAYDTCSRCTYTTYVEIPAKGHNLVHHDAQEATCTEIGWDAYDTCSRCTYTTYVEISAAHDIVHHAGQEATCTEIGWDAYDTCSRCDYTTYEEIPAKGHDIVHHTGQEATCTEIGWDTYDTCSRCDYTTYEEIPAKGHDIVHHTGQEATCTEIGWDAYDTCSRCTYTTYVEIPAAHDLVYHEGQEATCTEIGWEAYDTCSRCDYTTYEEISALGHNYENGSCTRCGDVIYIRVDANDEADLNGEYIYFGSYPQSEETDGDTKTALTALAGTLPTSSNSQAWSSYRYYINGSVDNYMWYIDLGYNGEKYRGVYFTSYRPYYTTNSSSTGNSLQDDNGYVISTVYWFKYEPIKWRILSEGNGQALILCEMIIDSQEYYQSGGTSATSHNGGTGYVNNYALSNIRKWLNNTFYNTAFTNLQKAIIQLTPVDNSARSTNTNNNTKQWNSGNNSYACGNTEDRVFLLSEQEVTNSTYGFNADYSNNDTVRRKKTTAYAQSQGTWTDATDTIYVGDGKWWLRSPHYNYTDSVRYVDYDGRADHDGAVYRTTRGVVPALKIRL